MLKATLHGSCASGWMSGGRSGGHLASVHALADSLRTDRRSFRHLQVESAEQIELREWSRMRDELQQEGTRLTNRMREQLRRHYPQMLELGGDLGATWFVELWEKAPTPAEAARIRKASIAAILKRTASGATMRPACCVSCGSGGRIERFDPEPASARRTAA